MIVIKNLSRTFCLFIILLIGAGNITHAAPLIYNSDTTISLSSPATNFIIKSGSVADSITINIGNIVVSMSTSTGGVFTLVSASNDVTVVTSVDGGNVEKNCTGAYLFGGTITVSISHTSGSLSTYTITPTASQCIVPAFSGGVGYQVQQVSSPAPVLNGESSGGTASNVASTATTTASVEIQSLQEQLASLQAILKSLREKAYSIATSLSTSVQASKFSRDLYFGLSGDDVVVLQIFLINKNVGPQAVKLAKVGATGKFFSLTKNALIEFQKNACISPAIGYFGPKTRAYIQALDYPPL